MLRYYSLLQFKRSYSKHPQLQQIKLLHFTQLRFLRIKRQKCYTHSVDNSFLFPGVKKISKAVENR